MHDAGDEFLEKTSKQKPVSSSVFGARRKSLLQRVGIRHRTADSQRSMLPVLIKVFAGFSKVDGEIVAADIDSSLGFLRYDYPEAVYSELSGLYRKALAESVDLNAVAKQLSSELTTEAKILLGVQLYVLISRSDNPKGKLISFYLFMTNLGVATEAIDLVYQLNTGEIDNALSESISERPDVEGNSATRPLETLQIGPKKPADVVVRSISENHGLIAFRYLDLILVKNIGELPVIVRGRQLQPGEFSRIYEGQSALIDERVVSFADLHFYFNAKKNVSSTQLFLAFENDGNVRVDKSLTADSALEVKFGLGVTVNALRPNNVTLNGQRLRPNMPLDASLEDKIELPDQREISLSDLRSRARELGGRFELSPSKFVYLVSNNPNLLQKGDILLSPGINSDMLLRITCDYKDKSGVLEILKSPRPIFIEDVQVKEKAPLRDGATITIGDGQFLACHFSERIIEEQRNLISQLEVRDLSFSYDRKEHALESISFSAKRGEMVCVLGPSGCGKSTLLRILAGHTKPDEGHILMNGYSLYRHLSNIRPYISFIPQEEAFDPLLTVEENIDFSAAIRCPHLAVEDRKKRRDGRLIELGLAERRHRLAGTPVNKNLSGGERKRLNAGMDMISISDIFLFDEPTSGLSSKDSEYVLEIIRGLAQNKITFVSIHQPSARLFHMFHKALLLDRGGKVAFYGTPAEMIDYFRAAGSEADFTGEHFGKTYLATGDTLLASPDLIFDVLETPLRDLSGDVIYEEDNRGHSNPARRFTPNFWRDRYQAHRLMQDVKHPSPIPNLNDQSKPRKLPQPPKRRLAEEAIHFGAQIRRAFLSKLRNRMNLVTTLLEAPALAVLIAVVLRYSEDGKYTFASAFHIPTYLFLTLVVTLFLGLTNSADEIIRDRALLQRERGHNVRVSYYLFSKFIALAFFALIQCVVYLLIGNAILGIRDMFFIYLWWMFLTSISGVAVGLFISSMVNDSKTALNIIPLILIPQIILGGALIKYEEMNSNLDFVYSLKRWIIKDTGESEPSSELKVPAICELMPMRWAYESIIIAQDQQNPLAASQASLERELQDLIKSETLTPEQEKRLEMVKEALALISGLYADSPGELHKELKAIKNALKNDTFNPADFPSPESKDAVSAVDLYQNQKVRDLVNKAEMERQDYRRKKSPNVFFGLKKILYEEKKPKESVPAAPGQEKDKPTKIEVGTLKMNAVVLFSFVVIGLAAVWVNLRRQLSRV
jgi:ABC-type multidrug transport system ATPase subunit/ABC-type multidrug transport system permease subunit